MIVSKINGFETIFHKGILNKYPKICNIHGFSESSNSFQILRKDSKSFLTITPRSSFLPLICSAIICDVSYGDFSDSIFNSYRNIYFWPNNMNIIPISDTKARKVCSGWKNSLVDGDSLFLDNIQSFYSSLDITNRVYYKWVPYNDKNNIRGLINVEINHQKKIIWIKEILLKPYLKPENFDLLVSDVKQMKLFKEYSTYEINLDTLSI